jgi:hypothetical protein
MIRRSRTLGLMLVLLCSSVGCWKAPIAEIRLTHVGQKLIRELTTWQEEKPNSPKEAWPSEELDRLRSVYATEPVSLDNFKRRFKGEFTDELPVDVNNKGRFHVYETPLGSQFVYLERIGGSDDIQAEVQRRIKASNRATDLLLGWLQIEFGKEPGWPKLQQFIDHQVRADIKNLSLLILFEWSQTPTTPLGGELTSPDTSYAYLAGFDSVMARAFQYGADHGYYTLAEIPQIARSFNSSAPSRYVARIVAREMGLPNDGPYPKSFDVLLQPDRFETSWKNYIKTTPEYAEAVRQLASQKEKEKVATDPTNLPNNQLFDDLLFGREKGNFRPTIQLSLTIDGDLVFSNGQAWDAQTKTIRWDPFVRTSPFFPRQVYAVWTKPNDEQQARLFGKTILTDGSLASYAQWYLGLTEVEKSEWNDFLTKEAASADFVTKLGKFRFTGTPPQQPKQPVSNSPFEGARFIIDALNKKPTEP